jgi:hypothetical protein
MERNKMGPTVKSIERANNTYNTFKTIISFYGWWEGLVGRKSINGFRFCRFCGLPVEANCMGCEFCGV